MSHKIEISRSEAGIIAQKFLLTAKEFGRCSGWPCVIAGSVRRLRPIVHDIDMVFVEGWDRYNLEFEYFLQPRAEIIKWGPKLAKIIYYNLPIDLYFPTPGTYNTLLLIRTGSKENNIRLCSIAKRKGWKLHASGDGLFNERGERIAGDGERSIYEALGVKWQEPWERG